MGSTPIIQQVPDLSIFSSLTKVVDDIPLQDTTNGLTYALSIANAAILITQVTI